MGKDIRLSVVVPVYNCEQYLDECIQSILKQTYTQFELIIVNDGSTDDSLSVCKRYAEEDSRVKVYDIENSGAYQARKYGVNRAVGELLTFADADDWLDLNAFEMYMNIYEVYKPDICAFSYIHNEKNVALNLCEEGFYDKERIKQLLTLMMFDPKNGIRQINPSLSCKLMKRELFLKVTEKVTGRINLGDDALVTYPAVCCADSLYMSNRIFYHYRHNTKSLTTQIRLERVEELGTFQKALENVLDDMGLRETLQSQIDHYVRSFFGMLTENWYHLSASGIKYAFPYARISNDQKLVIYGAGEVGKSYVYSLKAHGYDNLIAWIDKKGDGVYEYESEIVYGLQKLEECEYDVIVIAVYKEKMAIEITENLINRGVNREKIFWERPIGIV